MLGILCGLESEAKIARNIAGARVACAAARPDQGRALVRDLIRQGATCLISFGIAGSLSLDVKLGDVVIGTRVVSAKGQWVCDARWMEQIKTSLPQAKTGGCYGSEKLIATAQEKQNLYQSHRSLFVDMESQCVAEIAGEAQIPFVVVRTICDDATMNVPPLVMTAIKPDGGVDFLASLASFVRQPAQLGAVFHVMRGTGRALKALRQITPYITALSR